MADAEDKAARDDGAQADADHEAARQARRRGVPVVGLGASAGGIEAFTQFFAAMPADSGAAFVVVLHLDPTQNSQLAAILARHTAMPVSEIEDGVGIAANHV